MDAVIETEETREETIDDIVITLRDYLKTAPAAERLGIQAAIEIIESNY